MPPPIPIVTVNYRQHITFGIAKAKRLIRSAMSPTAYETWSREDLIARLRQLDSTLSDSRTPSTVVPRTCAKAFKAFDIKSYPRRKIALKFCYSGWEYNGLVFQSTKTRLPTVEATLYSALASCKLIDGHDRPQACGWERCGRTDVGVSSAAQVVSLWVRSNVGQGEAQSSSPEKVAETSNANGTVDNVHEISDSDFPPDSESELPHLDASEVGGAPPPAVLEQFEQKQELHYITILNRALPPSIRVTAWSPVSESFSARFNCTHRHYKYLFSPNGLDLDAMRDAAARLVGEHDFRNLCKLDASKQITNFRRRILSADINDAHATNGTITPQTHMCVLDLVGRAFLYNQVRHIVAILFLVGAGLEPPSIITALLNADPSQPEPPFRETEPPPELVTCKPEYIIADPLPLVLWECGYDEKDVNWQTDNFDNEDSSEANSLYRELHAIHTRSLIHSTLDATFLQAASKFHSPPPSHLPLNSASREAFLRDNPSTALYIPLGGGKSRHTPARRYTPLLQRNRLDHVDAINERWRQGKGARRAARQAEVVDAEEDE